MILIFQYRPEKTTYPGQMVSLDNGKKYENLWEGVVFIPSGVTISIELNGISRIKAGPSVDELGAGAVVIEKTVRKQIESDSRIVQKMNVSRQFALQSKNEKYAKFIDRQIAWQMQGELQISHFLEILDIETQYIKKQPDQHIRKRLVEINTLRKNIERIIAKSVHPLDVTITILQTMYESSLQDLQTERLGAKNPETISLLKYKLSRLFVEITELKKQRRNEYGCGFSDGEILNDPTGRTFMMKNGRLVEIDQQLDAVTYPAVMFTGCEFVQETRKETRKFGVSPSILAKFTEDAVETEFFFIILDENSLYLPVERGGFRALTLKNGSFEFVPYTIDPDLLFAVRSGSIQHKRSGMFIDVINREVVSSPQSPAHDLNIEKIDSESRYLFKISKFGVPLAKTPGDKLSLHFGTEPTNFFVIPVAKKKKS